MDFNKINKKRRFICALSLTLTILIVALYVVSVIIFGSRIILVPIIGLVLMIALLYCLSKFIVYKYYLKLKLEIINNSLLKESKANCVETYSLDNKFIYNFYSKKEIISKSKLKFIYEDATVVTEEFEVTERRNFKSDKVVASCKYLRFELKESYDDVVFIKRFDDNSSRFEEYYNRVFNKHDDTVYVNKKRYICFYEKGVNTKVLNVFDKLNAFHMISIKGNIAEIIFIDNTPVFDFKLQNSIDSKILNACSQCFNKLSKLLSSIRKEEL